MKNTTVFPLICGIADLLSVCGVLSLISGISLLTSRRKKTGAQNRAHIFSLITALIQVFPLLNTLIIFFSLNLAEPTIWPSGLLFMAIDVFSIAFRTAGGWQAVILCDRLERAAARSLPAEE